MAVSENVKGPLAVASYTADLFKLREQENGKSGYGVTLIYPKATDISVLEKIAVDAAVAEWGEKARQWIKDGVIKSPFLDGDGKQGRDREGNPRPELRNCRFIRCKSGADYKPKIFDKRRNPVLDVGGCPSGSQGFPVVNAYTWDHPSNGKGISMGISMFQVVKVATGAEVLGGAGAPDPEKFFETLADEGDAPASTKSGEGAAGLFG